MATINTENITTAEQLLQLPEDFGPCELVRGELIMMTPAGSEHAEIEMRLLLRLGNFVEEHKLGRVYPGDTGFLLEENKDTVRCPDVAFVCAARVPAGRIKGFFPAAPDFAVEIRSPSNRPGEVDEKIGQYLETGVQVVWDVDPESRTVTVHRPGETPEVYSGEMVLAEPELLPGFSIALKSIFN
jgi:Uma2 family endonuclease